MILSETARWFKGKCWHNYLCIVQSWRKVSWYYLLKLFQRRKIVNSFRCICIYYIWIPSEEKHKGVSPEMHCTAGWLIKTLRNHSFSTECDSVHWRSRWVKSPGESKKQWCSAQCVRIIYTFVSMKGEINVRCCTGITYLQLSIYLSIIYIIYIQGISILYRLNY